MWRGATIALVSLLAVECGIVRNVSQTQEGSVHFGVGGAFTDTTVTMQRECGMNGRSCGERKLLAGAARLVAVVSIAMAWSNHVQAGEPVAVNPAGYHIAKAALFDPWAAGRKPPAGTDLTAIAAFGAPTEFVPCAFSIHADKDIRRVEIDSFSLTGPGTIAAANVDVTLLRWLPRGRNGEMAPELFVKDDREVLKGVFPAGPDLPSIRNTGPVQTEIKAGQAKVFWVTCFIPERTAPGAYKGELVLKLDDENRSIPFALDVLPIQLQKPDDVLWGIWFQIGWTDADWSTLPEDERRKLNASRTFSWPVFEKYFKTTADCGFNIVSAPAWDSPGYGKIAELMKKYGMNAKVLFSHGVPWTYADKGYPETFTYNGMSLSEYARKGVEFAKQHGYPRPLLGMEDENTDWQLQEKRRALIKPEGTDTWMCVNEAWQEMHKVMGYPMCCGGLTRTKAREAHRYGNASGEYYQTWFPGNSGNGIRKVAGYNAWNFSADSFLHYTMLTYSGDPYDDTDGQYVDWNTLFCSREGPVMTFTYAGHRAGVDDYRYVHTLVNLIAAREKAAGSRPDRMNRLAMVRAELQHLLMRNAYSPSDYEQDRRAVADLILKTQELERNLP
jgi:hypothetical protein